MRQASVLLFTAAIMTVLTSCHPKGMSPGEGGGSVIGNGMNFYNNDVMHVRFSYPQAWTINESADRRSVNVSNVSIALASQPTTLRFSIAPDFAGHSFRSLAELESFLKSSDPQKTWMNTSFVSGQQGFFFKEVGANGENARYVLLDPNNNVLDISYTAMSTGAARVVQQIVLSMTVDQSPPLINRVYFEPATAAPGETVKVVVEGWDESGELFYDTMFAPWSSEFNSLSSSDSQFALNYLNPANPTAPFVLGSNYMLGGVWVREGEDRFTHLFVVPAHAPAGQIVMSKLTVGDKRENAVRFELVGSAYEVRNSNGALTSVNQSPLQIESLVIVRKPDSAAEYPIPGTITRAWFWKSFWPVKSSPQRLYFEVADRRDMRPSAKFHFSRECTSLQGSLAYQWAPLKNEGDGVYSVEFTWNDSLGNCYHPGFIRLEKIEASDEGGGLIEFLPQAAIAPVFEYSF